MKDRREETQTEMEMERHEADYKTSAGKESYIYFSSLVVSESAAASLREFGGAGLAQFSQCTRLEAWKRGVRLGCRPIWVANGSHPL